MLTIVPFLLIPIESIFPYPFLIEEIIKLIIILGLPAKYKKNILIPIIGGFLFAFTETILYINNIQLSGQPNLILKRLLITGGMHSLTMVLMYLGFSKNIKWGIVCFLLAIVIHYLYNFYC